MAPPVVSGSSVLSHEGIAEEVMKQTEALSLVSADNESSDVTMLIGKSGSGKSTLVNLLGGSPLAAKKVRGQMSLYVPDTASTPLLQSFQIGTGHSGCTTAPNKWVSERFDGANHDLGVVWDLPGFGDNRGAATALSNAILAQKVFDTAGRMKLVVVLTDLSILESRGEELLLVTEQLDALLYSDATLETLQGCVSIVLTGTGPEREVADLRETIGALLEENAIQFSPHQKTILTLLRSAPVVFFPKPTQAGPLDPSDQKAVQHTIEVSITQTTQYTDGGVATFVVLPDSAKVTLLECERLVGLKIRIAIETVKSAFLSTLQAFCDAQNLKPKIDALKVILQNNSKTYHKCCIKYIRQIVANVESGFSLMETEVPTEVEDALQKTVSSVEALRYIRKFSTCQCAAQKEAVLRNEKTELFCGTEVPQLESIAAEALVILERSSQLTVQPAKPGASPECKAAVKTLINEVAREAIKEAAEKHMAEHMAASKVNVETEAEDQEEEEQDEVMEEEEDEDELFSFKALGLKGGKWKSCAACSAASLVTAGAMVAVYVSPESADSILTTYITFLSKFLGAHE